MPSGSVFKIYRYQILPIDRYTRDFWGELTVEDLLKKKNEIFASAIPFVGTYRHRGSELSVQVERVGSDAFFVKLAPFRTLTRETADFRTEQIEHWPHVFAIILNSPEEQYILVQQRTTAFSSTDTVVKVLEKATRKALENAGLRLHIESMFEKSYFWKLVNEYHGRITWVEFEFITPNMSNISGTLANTLKDLSKDTNSSKTELELQSDSKSALNLDPSNATISGLVDYTSEGTGDISLKVRGIRKRFHTASSSREIVMSDIEISGPAEQVVAAARSLLK